MGKAALIYMAAATMMLTGIYSSWSRTEVETDIQQNQYEEQVLARQIAYSGFNLTLARSRQEFASYRPDESGVAYRGGFYDVRVDGPAQGPLVLGVTGYYGDASHTIEADLEKVGTALLEPLIVDGPIDALSLAGNSISVTGYDSNHGEGIGSGPGPHATGSRFVDGDAYTQAMSVFDAEDVTGLGTTTNPDLPDLTTGDSGVDIDALAEAIALRAGDDELDGDQELSGNDTWGTESEPVYRVINGNFSMSGNGGGVGALLVNGTFSSSGNASWEGLIIAQANGDHTISGNELFSGVLVLRGSVVGGGSGGGAESDGGGEMPCDDEDEEEGGDDEGDECDSDDLSANWSGSVLSFGSGGLMPAGLSFHLPASLVGLFEHLAGPKVTICHIPPGNPDNAHTIEVSENAVPAHEAHGDTMGDCEDPDEEEDATAGDDEDDSGKITICHYPPGNPENMQTISISPSAWPAHEAHGDEVEDCDAEEETGDEEDEGGGDSGDEEDGEEDADEEEDGETEVDEGGSGPEMRVLLSGNVTIRYSTAALIRLDLEIDIVSALDRAIITSATESSPNN